MSGLADRLRAVAASGGPALALVLAGTAFAQSERPYREDLDHRYRLTIAVPRTTATRGEELPTTLCLSPTTEERVAVCLGEKQGHAQIGDHAGTTTFKLPPEDHPACTCARPVELVRGEPLCWQLPARIGGIGGDAPMLSGFVTILEDVRDVGGSSPTCLEVRSNGVGIHVVVPEPEPRPPAPGGPNAT